MRHYRVTAQPPVLSISPECQLDELPSPTIAIRAGRPATAICSVNQLKTCKSSELGRVGQPSGWLCHSPTYSSCPPLRFDTSSSFAGKHSLPRMYRVGHSALSGGEGMVSTT